MAEACGFHIQNFKENVLKSRQLQIQIHATISPGGHTDGGKTRRGKNTTRENPTSLQQLIAKPDPNSYM
jgi:hypothetical protein